MSEQQQSKFEGYAIVEIMGHNREIGYVTTEYFGGPALFRVDSPGLPERDYTTTRPQWIGDVHTQAGTVVRREATPGKTAYVGPQAVFRLTPCTKEVAEAAIDEMIPAPRRILSMPDRKALPSGVDAEIVGDDRDDEVPF